jgi:large subunit ribosomal protein L15
MELHSLSATVSRGRRRLGQGPGSGRGKTAGRGTKGQKARNKVPLRFEGGALALTKRIPYLRGKMRNRSLQAKPVVINLDVLSRLPANSVVDLALLRKHNLVSDAAEVVGIKILGAGEITNVYTVKLSTSKAAADKITKAGGSVEVVE